MKFLIQFLVIVIFAFMGEVLHHAIPAVYSARTEVD